MTHLSPDDDPPVSGLAPFWRRRDLPDIAGDARRLGRYVTASSCFVVAWSLVELPWEIDLSGSAGADGAAYASGAPMSSAEEIAAVLASKTLLFFIVGLVLKRRIFAKYVLLFVCLMSVLAMAPEIPVEYAHSRWLATLSVVECLGKLATFVFLALDLRAKR
jgi:general stress protein CsbA